MEVSDYGGVRSNPTPPPMKGELLVYVEKTDTYTCDFCGHNAKWDASDDVHGELWSCEAEGCGKVFCSKCFISAFGQEIYMTMMQSGENVLCPECAKKKYKKENEK